MSRSALSLSVFAVAALLCAAAARTNRPSYSEQFAEFQKKARAERRKLPEDLDVRARFPTPEIALVRDEPVEVKPGQTVEVKLTGKLQPGSLVLLESSCDEAEVVALEQTEETVSAKVKVPERWLPRECAFQVFAPVSLISAWVPAFKVVGDYQWDLVLGNRLTTRFVAKVDEEGRLGGAPEWFQGGKSLGVRGVQIERRNQEVLFRVERSQADTEHATQAVKEAQTEAGVDSLMKQMRAITDQMSKECSKLPTAKLSACYAKYQKQLRPISERIQKVGERQEQLFEVHPAACHELRLRIAPDGGVTGTGLGCLQPGELPVTGRLSVL